jgi:predicted SnoaL-like aldol condensation-catalyzing enzyme
MKKMMSIAVLVAVMAAGAHAFKSHAATTLDVNKQIVSNFYTLAFNDHQPAKAVEKYVGSRYTQHNPSVPDGPQAFIEFVTKYSAANPHLHVDIKRMIAEGDLVVTHVLITTAENDRGAAAMDIFRLEDGRIVEHWDVVQPVPEKSANTNTMF